MICVCSVFWKSYDMEQARTLLKSLVIIGAILGSVLGIVGTCVPWFFPNIFTPDQNIILEVGSVPFELFLNSFNYISFVGIWFIIRALLSSSRELLSWVLWLLIVFHFIISAAFHQATTSWLWLLTTFSLNHNHLIYSDIGFLWVWPMASAQHKFIITKRSSLSC